ncbi:MAG: Ku protein [Gaiellaceae bacterium]
MTDLPRSTWDGALQLRELVLPVGLASARRSQKQQLKLLHAEPCGQPIGQARWCPEHGKVPDEEIVKGWEIAKGQFAPVDVDELAAAAPADSRSINVYAIVRADQVDPLLAKRAYYLLPGRGRASLYGYAALADALCAEQLVGLARWTAHGFEHVGLLDSKPAGKTLLLHELVTPGELRDVAPIAELVDSAQLSTETVDLARKLLARLEVPYDPELLRNHHAERVQAVLEAQLSGDRIIHAPPVVDEPPTVSSNVDQALTASFRGIPRARKQRLAEALAR